MDINSLNIKKYRENKGLSQSELADMVGVSFRTIQNYEAGTKIPKSKYAIFQRLFSDSGNNSSNSQKPEAQLVDFEEMQVMYVPLVSKFAYAGFLDNFGDDEYVDELPKVPFADDKQYRGEYVCFEVKGDSMDDGSVDSILEGDILLCRNVKQEYWKSRLHIHKWKEFVIVHREKGILVKQITKHDTETNEITIHSLNEYYDDEVLHLKNIQAIYNVVDLRRKRYRR